VTNPVRVVVPVVPGVLPVLRRQCCMMGNALLNALMGTMLRPLADAELVIIHVPAAPDPRAHTAQAASSPGLCAKAAACPAAERASTRTTGSAKVPSVSSSFLRLSHHEDKDLSDFSVHFSLQCILYRYVYILCFFFIAKG